MLDIRIKPNSALDKFLSKPKGNFDVETISPEEKVKVLIVRDLLRLGWDMNFKANRVLIKPPAYYDKQIIKDSMRIRRQESFLQNREWIKGHLDLARQNLVDGASAWDSPVEPVIEVCDTQRQHDIFRIFRFSWSSPYSEYVGRRIRLLIRDGAIPSRPLIGIAALGSSIIHIPERDKWIGWDKETRTKNLIYTMDAYILGALPPYNYLLGGKLISYIIASNEIRDIHRRKYKGKVTEISKRVGNRLACIFTTSLYGKSSQYNRVKYNRDLLYIPIGSTKGYGTLHLTDETFKAMRDLLAYYEIPVTNRFGDGPIWRMRVIRTAADILGFDADFLLRHSFRRAIYAVPLAHNSWAFLRGQHSRLRNCDYPLEDMVGYWRDRWLAKRKANIEVKRNVYSFHANGFTIS